MNFADVLCKKMLEKGNPVCVGIDPRPELLPQSLSIPAKPTLAEMAQAVARFSLAVVECVHRLVPVVKFQSAFFECLGPAGGAALDHAASAARDAGLIVIIDGKRNDIGSTAEAYAQAYLSAESDPRFDRAPWPAHALTINPYLGGDGVRPFVEAGAKAGKGAFCLVRNSNPSAKEFQDLIAEGKPLYRHVAERVQEWAYQHIGECGFSLLGAVVGATYPAELAELRGAMPNVPFLVPGYGAQGGTAADVASAFDPRGLGAIVNNSRGILSAHTRPDLQATYGDEYQGAIVHAVKEMIADLAAHTPAGALRR